MNGELSPTNGNGDFNAQLDGQDGDNLNGNMKPKKDIFAKNAEKLRAMQE